MNEVMAVGPLRLPGLYRAWELCQIIGSDHAVIVEPADQTCDGEPLFAVYRYPEAEVLQ